MVLALPVTSLPSASLPITHRNNSTQQKAKHAAEYVKHNRIFRQTEALSPKLIVGFKLEGDPKSILESESEYTIRANAEVSIRIFSTGFPDGVKEFLIGFSDEPPSTNEDKNVVTQCHVRAHTIVHAIVGGKHDALAKISLPREPDNLPYFLCYAFLENDGPKNFFYAGNENEHWFKIKSEAPIVPVWLMIILIGLLLTMSGLFSGLNLGLMALDKNELQVIERCGTEQEKFWSRSIAPVRKKGNYLLCTLLLGNVLVNSTLTIFMDELTSGVFAIISSTLAIVIFGEIIPQALCSRHGLAVGASTIYITYLFMGITFPLSFPISLLLDKLLGEEIGNVYDRERLMEYIRVTKDYNRLEADEMNIISGALKFKNIRVSAVMTPIDDVFMLPYSTTLNFETISLINNSGYSRIPVYENERDNVVGILHVKDLSLIDADHNFPLKVVLDFYSHPLFSVFEDVTLDVMLNEFKKGKSHMALVRRVIDNGITDPFYELLGVVTLEDIIEELIQAEINDETDVITDNRRKQKRKEVQSKPNYLDFIRYGFNNAELTENCDRLCISPQLALAALRFLASSVEPFRPDYLSEEILKILMAKNIYFEAKGQPRKQNILEMSPENLLYVRGEPADYFIMILEGRARIIVTSENQEYDAGPFCVFGVKALTKPSTGAPAGVVGSFDTKSEDRPVAQSEEVTAENSPNASSSPLNQVVEASSAQHSKDGCFIPDFSLFCMEKVIYMKVTQKLYDTAIRTTEIEKQRTSSLSQSMSGVGSGSIEVSASLFDSTRPAVEANPPFHKERKTSQYLLDTQTFRKISISTNLPESSVFQLQNQHAAFHADSAQKSHSISNDKLLVNCNPDDASASKMNAPHRKQGKALSTESMPLKRSDAVDLLMDPVEETPPPEGQIQMISLSKDSESHSDAIDDGDGSAKSGNGSVKCSTGQAASPEPKATDLVEELDETSHLI